MYRAMGVLRYAAAVGAMGRLCGLVEAAGM